MKKTKRPQRFSPTRREVTEWMEQEIRTLRGLDATFVKPEVAFEVNGKQEKPVSAAPSIWRDEQGRVIVESEDIFRFLLRRSYVAGSRFWQKPLRRLLGSKASDKAKVKALREHFDLIDKMEKTLPQKVQLQREVIRKFKWDAYTPATLYALPETEKDKGRIYLRAKLGNRLQGNTLIKEVFRTPRASEADNGEAEYHPPSEWGKPPKYPE